MKTSKRDLDEDIEKKAELATDDPSQLSEVPGVPHKVLSDRPKDPRHQRSSCIPNVFCITI